MIDITWVDYCLNSAAWAALGAFGARYLYRHPEILGSRRRGRKDGRR